MKKICLSAYCCMNFGDDLFVKTLVRRYPDTIFFMNIDNKSRAAFRNEINIVYPSQIERLCVKVLCKLRIIKKIDAEIYHVRRADGYVKIGGSIFIETAVVAKKYVEQYNENSFFIGPNFGPFQSRAYVERVRLRLANVKDCCFRDSYSYKLFQDLSNVRYAPDVLFSLSTGLDRVEGRYLGISVILLDNREGLSQISDEYYATISDACNECRHMNIPVRLFAFCKREGDADAMKKILSYTDHPEEIDTCVYEGDTEIFMAQLNECRWLLATRLHSMILGLVLGKKVLPIVYSLKQTHILEDMNYCGHLWDIHSHQKYDSVKLLEDCLGNIDMDIAKYAQDSERQFEALDEFLRQ